jgi:outer membrane protein assembly factor BamB
VPEVPSPLVYRGHLFFIRNGGLFTCLDIASGTVLYEDRLRATGGYYASPIAAGGKIYTASDRGVVSVLEAAGEFKLIRETDLQEPIMATPAIANGKLYVRTASQLLAFGER